MVKVVQNFKESIADIIDKKVECPLPLEIIPNYMGINLCNVESIQWQKLEDGQLTNLKINFIPDVPKEVFERDSKGEDFKFVVEPVIKYLAENHHPHTMIEVESNRATLWEGKKSIVTDKFIVD